MMQKAEGFWTRCVAMSMAMALLLGAAGARAANDPAAWFRGAPTYDLAVTNVKWDAATPEYS